MTETTTARALKWSGLIPWAIVAILTVLGVPGIIAGWPALVRLGATAHLHGFDTAVFTAQPLAMQLHIIAISLTVPLGAVMMASRKGRRFHRITGWIWAGLVSFAAVTPVWLALVDHYWRPIHLVVVLVMTLLITGIWAARSRNVARHRARMMWLYYGSILGAGAATFLPGRLLWRLFFG